MSSRGSGPTYEMPARLSEPAGKQLGAFGITSLPGARINAVDPAVSRAQRRFFAIAEHHPEQLRGRMPKMTRAQMHEFAATPERGLPKRKR